MFFFIVFVSVSAGLQRAHGGAPRSLQRAGADTSIVSGGSMPARRLAVAASARLRLAHALMRRRSSVHGSAPRAAWIPDHHHAMQNFQIVLLWCAVLLAVASSLLIYGLLTVLESRPYARFG